MFIKMELLFMPHEPRWGNVEEIKGRPGRIHSLHSVRDVSCSAVHQNKVS